MRTSFVVVIAAVALGVVGQVSDGYGPDAGLLFALGAPWLILAFLVGLLTGKPGAAAVALGLSVLVYYAVMLIAEHRGGRHYALAMTALWGAAGLVCGLAFGSAGAALRSARPRTRAIGLTLLGGALAGEAALFLTFHSGGSAVLTAELVAGCVLVGVALCMLAAARMASITPCHWAPPRQARLR